MSINNMHVPGYSTIVFHNLFTLFSNFEVTKISWPFFFGAVTVGLRVGTKLQEPARTCMGLGEGLQGRYQGIQIH